MQSGLTLDVVIDALGERVAAKVLAGLAQRGTTAAVNPRLLTVEQAAVYVGRTTEAMQHLIAEGKLPVVRADRRVFLDLKDLDQWIEQNKA